MSLKECKRALIGMLHVRTNQVLAITGSWGTGKTFMWREVQQETAELAVQKALYASLFSVESIPDLKVKLARSKLGNDPDGTWKTGQKVMGRFRDVLKDALPEYSPVMSAIDTIALVAVPAVLRNQVLVLDDLERKPASISTDALLGFINEFVEHFGCRFVLILNDDEWKSPDDKATWETLREKIIDQEIRLQTTPADAFYIATKRVPTLYADFIRPVVEMCGVTNIRVIRKVIEVVNTVLAGHEQVAADISHRIIPSTVLLTSIHFRGVQQGPSTEYVLEFNEMVARSNGRREEAGADEQRWDRLLSKLEIRSIDEYERELVKYLRSGVLDAAAVLKSIRSYVADSERQKAHSAADEFHTFVHFRPDLSVAQLLDAGVKLVPLSGRMNPRQLSSICSLLRELDPTGAAVADDLVTGWVRHFRQNPPSEDIDLDDWNPFGDVIEPEIEQAIVDLRTARSTPVSLIEAADAVANGTNGARARAAFAAASPEMYMDVIKKLVGNDLKLFMREHFSMVKRPGEDEFGHAASSFLDGCRRIVNDPQADQRLVWIIRRLCETQRPPIQL